MSYSKKPNWKTIRSATDTLEKREALLNKWRHPGAQLSSIERECVMQVLWDTAWQAAAKHYNNPTGGTRLVPCRSYQWYFIPYTAQQREAHDVQMERVLLLGEMLRERLDKEVGWSFTAFRRRIAQVERYIQIKSKGLGTPKSVQCVAVTGPNRVASVLRALSAERHTYTDEEILQSMVSRYPAVKSTAQARRELDSYRRLVKMDNTTSLKEWHHPALTDEAVWDNVDIEDALRPNKEGEQCRRKLKSYTYLVT